MPIVTENPEVTFRYGYHKPDKLRKMFRPETIDKVTKDKRTGYSKANKSLKARRLLRESRLTQMMALYQKGYGTWQICHEMGINDVRLFKYNEVLKKRFNEQFRDAADQYRGFITHKYELIYKSSIEGFERSQIDKDGKPRPGNVAFLEMADQALQQMRKLLGLDKQVDVVNNNNTFNSFNWDSVARTSIPATPIPIEATQITSSVVVDPIEDRLQQMEALKRETNDEHDSSNHIPNLLLSSLSDNTSHNHSKTEQKGGMGEDQPTNRGVQSEGSQKERTVKPKLVLKRKVAISLPGE